MPLDAVKNPLWDLDTEQVARDVAEELLRQAELRQEANFRAALGMDQRAAVLAAGLIAGAGALAAAGMAIGPQDVSVRAAAFAGACAVAIAAGCCAWACRPQLFRFPGVMPLRWGIDPTYLAEDLHVIRMARAAELQDHMAQNDRRQHRNGAVLSVGLLTAAAAPFVAVISWLVCRTAGFG